MTPHDDLAGALLRHAAGLTSDTAAAELICAHHTWLTRTDFITSYIHAGTRHDGHPYAYIDWERAITALDTRSSAAHPQKLASCASPPASATTTSPSTSPKSWAPSTRPTSAWSPPPSPAPTADQDNPATATTTRAPPGPAGPVGGAFPVAVMPTQRDADMPNQRVAEHRACSTRRSAGRRMRG